MVEEQGKFMVISGPIMPSNRDASSVPESMETWNRRDVSVSVSESGLVVISQDHMLKEADDDDDDLETKNQGRV